MFLNEDIKEITGKIIEICISPKIDYPVGSSGYYGGCEPVIYGNLIYNCIRALGLDDINNSNRSGVVKGLEKAVDMAYRWLNEGYEIYIREAGCDTPVEQVPLAYFLHMFEKNRNHDSVKAINVHPAYYLLALQYLYDYKRLHLAHYRKDSADFTGGRVDPLPYQQSIDASACLLAAQICFEMAGASYDKACGYVRETGFINQLAEVEKKKVRAQKGIRELNDVKTWLQNTAKELAAKEWQTDTLSKIRIGMMSDHIIVKLVTFIDDDCSIDLDKKPLFKKNIPKNPTMKKWIRSVAPEYAKKGGR